MGNPGQFNVGIWHGIYGQSKARTETSQKLFANGKGASKRVALIPFQRYKWAWRAYDRFASYQEVRPKSTSGDHQEVEPTKLRFLILPSVPRILAWLDNAADLVDTSTQELGYIKELTHSTDKHFHLSWPLWSESSAWTYLLLGSLSLAPPSGGPSAVEGSIDRKSFFLTHMHVDKEWRKRILFQKSKMVD